ncbi:MAG: filamentous hemagglutinin N-terminal domain-containing protein [Candidatus Marithrix sp.]
MKVKLILIIFLLGINLSIQAEIITDGSLGQQLNLPGPNFQITSNLGQQHGGNLFHSFQDFNLNSSEIATFSGPNNVNNIISRVTGGNPSNIDGLIHSTIPNADMYFLNPYGIMFGPNAKLDVQGSFHTSTADYLKLGNEGRFDTRNPADSLLTVAPVSAFGFLTNNPSSITIDNSKLSLPDKKTFSFISGDLDIKGEDFFYSADWFTRPFKMDIEDEKSALIKTMDGNIDLISFSEAGEVQKLGNKLVINEKVSGGTITINNTHINISGKGGANAFIYGGNVNFSNSGINAEISGNTAKKTNINIYADDLMFKNSSLIDAASAIGSGIGGDININVTGNFIMSGLHPRSEALAKATQKLNMNWIFASAFDKGTGGNIYVEANEMTLLDSSQIDVSVLGNGNAGDSIIKVKVHDVLTIAGQHPTNTIIVSAIGSFSESQKPNSGNSGFVDIEAGKILLLDAGTILSTATGSGNAGTVRVKVAGDLIMSGVTQVADDPFEDSSITLIPWASGIMAGAIPIYVEGSSPGKAGNIEIEARNIIIRNGAQITSYTGGRDPGGNVKIVAKEIIAEGQNLVEWNSPNGRQELLFKSGISSASFSEEKFAGGAGNVTIIADKITVKDNAEITTQTENAAGGDINITVPELVYIKGGTISTSANGGKGNGGNINIRNPQFTVLGNNGQIKAQADAGHGGNITLKTDNLIQSTNSLISASSRLGLDGNIRIDSPDLDMEGFLVTLPGEFTEVSGQMKNPCNISGNSFIVKKINGSSPTPYDYKRSYVVLDNTKKAISKDLNKDSPEKLAYASEGCKHVD